MLSSVSEIKRVIFENRFDIEKDLNLNLHTACPDCIIGLYNKCYIINNKCCDCDVNTIIPCNDCIQGDTYSDYYKHCNLCCKCNHTLCNNCNMSCHKYPRCTKYKCCNNILNCKCKCKCECDNIIEYRDCCQTLNKSTTENDLYYFIVKFLDICFDVSDDIFYKYNNLLNPNEKYVGNAYNFIKMLNH
jgi:hypothetical protein